MYPFIPSFSVIHVLLQTTDLVFLALGALLRSRWGHFQWRTAVALKRGCVDVTGTCRTWRLAIGDWKHAVCSCFWSLCQVTKCAYKWGYTFQTCGYKWVATGKGPQLCFTLIYVFFLIIKDEDILTVIAKWWLLGHTRRLYHFTALHISGIFIIHELGIRS